MHSAMARTEIFESLRVFERQSIAAAVRLAMPDSGFADRLLAYYFFAEESCCFALSAAPCACVTNLYAA